MYSNHFKISTLIEKDALTFCKLSELKETKARADTDIMIKMYVASYVAKPLCIIKHRKWYFSWPCKGSVVIIYSYNVDDLYIFVLAFTYIHIY